MKTFASKEKRPAPTLGKAVSYTPGAIQQTQKDVVGKILRPDEMQSKTDTRELDINNEQVFNGRMMDFHISSNSDIVDSDSPIRKPEDIIQERALLRQP